MRNLPFFIQSLSAIFLYSNLVIERYLFLLAEAYAMVDICYLRDRTYYMLQEHAHAEYHTREHHCGESHCKNSHHNLLSFFNINNALFNLFECKVNTFLLDNRIYS